MENSKNSTDSFLGNIISLILISIIFILSFGCKKEEVNPNQDKIKPNTNMRVDLETNYFKNEISPGLKLNIICNLLVQDKTSGKTLFNYNCDLRDTVNNRQYSGVIFTTSNYDQYRVYSECVFTYSKKNYTPVSAQLYHNLKTTATTTVIDFKAISLTQLNDSTFISKSEFIFN